MYGKPYRLNIRITKPQSKHVRSERNLLIIHL